MTSTDHPIRCKCGRLNGVMAQAAKGTRGTCYCRDCQAYAHALGNPEATLDHLGGTDLVATLQKHISFTPRCRVAGLPVADRGRPVALVRELLQYAHRQHGAKFKNSVRRSCSHLPRSIATRFGRSVWPDQHADQRQTCQSTGGSQHAQRNSFLRACSGRLPGLA